MHYFLVNKNAARIYCCKDWPRFTYFRLWTDPYLSEPSQTYSNLSELIQTYLNLPETIRTYLNLSKLIQSYLNLSEPILSLSEPIWTYLNLSDPIWSYLILSEPIWSYLIQLQMSPGDLSLFISRCHFLRFSLFFMFYSRF